MFHSSLYNSFGDADMNSSYSNKYVDPVLRPYTNISLILNMNECFEQGRGNETLAKFKNISSEKYNLQI